MPKVPVVTPADMFLEMQQKAIARRKRLEEGGPQQLRVVPESPRAADPSRDLMSALREKMAERRDAVGTDDEEEQPDMDDEDAWMAE